MAPVGFLSFFLCAFVALTPGWSQDFSMPGDLNGDDEVNGLDFFLYALTFDPGGYRVAPEADSNQDFHVDHRDLFLALLTRLRGLGEPPIYDPNEVGDVEGVVLQDTGDATVVIPIPGAEVWIGLPDGFRFKTITDGNGQFRFEGVPAGVAYLRAAHPGYHPGEARVEVVTGATIQVSLSLAPRRGDLADVVGFVHGLIEPVSGQPIFNDPVPIPGATVRIMPLLDGGVVPEILDPNHSPGSADPDQVAHTDERGHYRLYDIPPGHYLMVVFAPGFEAERREVVIESPGDHMEDFVLSPADHPQGRVAGTVYSVVNPDFPHTLGPESFPRPLPGAVVTLEPLYDLGGAPQPIDPTLPLPFPFYETVTNGSGEYVFRNVFPGLYHARAWAREHEPQEVMVEVAEGETTQQDFELPRIVIERGNLAGRVFGASQNLGLPVPLANAVVAVFPWSNTTGPEAEVANGTGGGIVDPNRVRSTTTDEDGNYFFEGLPIGTYLLLARAQGWGKATDTIEIVADVTTTADLVILYTPPPPPGTLVGTVFSVVPDTLGLPVPIEGATVLAFPADPDLIDVLPAIPIPLKVSNTDPGLLPPEWEPYRTETNENGEYLFPSLPPGAYRLMALAEGHHPAEQLVRLPSGQTLQHDFYLQKVSDSHGIVLGKVYTVGPDGQFRPIGGAKVSLESLQPIPLPYPTTDLAGYPQIRFETMTDDRGHFEFPRVPAGLYILCVQAEGFRIHKSDLFVEGGQETTVEVELFPRANDRTGALEGHVWQAANAIGDGPYYLLPIPGAIVTVVPLCGSDDPLFTDPNQVLPGEEFCFPLVTRTGPDGAYRFEEVHAGRAIVIVVAEGFEPGVEYVYVEAGQTRVLDFFLKPSGSSEYSSLHGQVSQRTEFPTFAPVPVVGAEVHLVYAGMVLHEKLNPVLEYRTETDDRGFYEFPELGHGPYVLNVSAERFVPVTNFHVEIPHGQRVRQDVVLQPIYEGEGRLHGTVYEIAGNDAIDPIHSGLVAERTPSASATVRLIPEGLAVIEIFPPPNVGFDRITDASGNYVFESLPAGWYDAYILKEGFVPAIDKILIEGNDNEQRDYYIFPIREPVTRVEGTVTEDSGLLPVWLPIEGALVLLVDSIGDIYRTDTNDDGHFAFEDANPGVYRLTVEASGYITQMREGHVAEGHTSYQAFALQKEGQGNASIRGRVQEDTGFLDVWIPIGGATVSLFGPTQALPPILTTTTDAEGQFGFEEVAPGDYGLLVEASGYHSQDRHVGLLPGEVEHVLFELKSEAMGEVGNIEGRVTAVVEGGAPFPVPGIPVYLSSPDGSIGHEFIQHSAVTDDMGLYRFEGVPAGEATVTLGFPGQEGPSLTVEVPAGGTAIANFEFDPLTTPLPF
jgi:hypothetical protein